LYDRASDPDELRDLSKEASERLPQIPRASQAGQVKAMKGPMDHLDTLEARSVFLFREAYANFKSLGMLWSIGKDSTVLLWLARKAFFRPRADAARAHRYVVQDS
jgi:3'-phosphoadenosine 5'-phosphosulfate sulfotransferase (PAPS reductase)/FAD synthetase